jgi:hypothetical protein
MKCESFFSIHLAFSNLYRLDRKYEDEEGKWCMEQAMVNETVVNLVDVATIQSMHMAGTVDFIEEIFVGETEFKCEGVYKLFYSHNNKMFYAAWDRYMSWLDYETSGFQGGII